MNAAWSLTWVILLFLVMSVLPAPVQAQAAAQPAWMFILENALSLLALVLTPVLVLLGKRAAAWLAARLELEQSAALEAQVEVLIERGISYAEEQSRKALKSGGEPMPGDEKLRQATTAIRRWAEEQGLPEMATARIEELIEAQLGAEPYRVSEVQAGLRLERQKSEEEESEP